MIQVRIVKRGEKARSYIGTRSGRDGRSVAFASAERYDERRAAKAKILADPRTEAVLGSAVDN